MIGLGTSVLARVYSIGHERILLQGAVTAWPEIVRCQIDCEGIVECRTAAENYRVRAPREFVDALRHCLRERGLEAEQSSMEVEL